MSGPGCFWLDHKIGQIFLEAQIQQKLCLLIQDPLSWAPSWTTLSFRNLHRLTLRKVKENILTISRSRFATCIYIWIGGYIARFTHSDIFHTQCNGRHGYISDIPGADVCNGYNPPSVAASASSVPPNSKAGLARGKNIYYPDGSLSSSSSSRSGREFWRRKKSKV